MNLRDEYLEKAEKIPVFAATLLAADLMEGDPRSFKAGYSRENAILSAVEFFPEVDKDEIEALLDLRRV